MAEQSKLSTLFTGIAAFAALLVAIMVVKRELFPTDRGGMAPENAIAEPVDNWTTLVAGGHRYGSANAKVVIVEFGDFQCPACGRFHESLQAVIAKYGSDVAVVFRQWPLEELHPIAYAAARAAECASAQAAFKPMHDELFAQQDELGGKSLVSIAADAGVSDTAKFAKCMEVQGRVDAIERDIELARSMELRGTPTIIINGLRYGSVPNKERLDRLVRYHLDKLADD
ncbi:MAG: thioredoxin domain-containing protein [Gemmatimonadota bacterium]